MSAFCNMFRVSALCAGKSSEKRNIFWKKIFSSPSLLFEFLTALTHSVDNIFHADKAISMRSSVDPFSRWRLCYWPSITGIYSLLTFNHWHILVTDLQPHTCHHLDRLVTHLQPPGPTRWWCRGLESDPQSVPGSGASAPFSGASSSSPFFKKSQYFN